MNSDKNNTQNSQNAQNTQNTQNQQQKQQGGKPAKPMKPPESAFKRKLKYGSVAMIFTIVFVAVIFLINIVMTAIHMMKPMFIDMTKEQIYGISDASKELLKDVKSPVEIVFFMPMDMYEKNVRNGKMIVNCIKTFENEFDFVSIKTVDIIKNPLAANEYKSSELSRLQTTSIAVKSGNTPKLLAASAFFVIAQSNNSLMGFAGERTLTQAILQVTETESPIVYFTMGHAESDLSENGLATLFLQNGFLVKMIDLNTEDIDPDAKIIVICNPRKDFIGGDPNDPSKKSEIDKIASFLNNFGNVMYFTSPEVTMPLPELDDLLKEYNIAIERNTMLVDQKNAVDTSGLSLSAQYNQSGGAGDELHASIRNLSSRPRTVVPKVKPIRILDMTTEVRVSQVLTSYDSAVKYDMDENKAVAQGEFNLMVLAQKTQYVNNEPKSSLFLVCGSADFLSGQNLLTNSYGNPDIILNAMRIMSNRKIATDIKWKEFDNKSLIMSLEEQSFWTLICLLLLPSIVSLAGIVVWLGRRHS